MLVESSLEVQLLPHPHQHIPPWVPPLESHPVPNLPSFHPYQLGSQHTCLEGGALPWPGCDIRAMVSSPELPLRTSPKEEALASLKEEHRDRAKTASSQGDGGGFSP